MFRIKSVGFKIFASSLFFIAIIIGITYWHTIQSSRELLINTTVELTESKAVRRKEVIETSLQEIKNVLHTVSKTPPIQGMFRAQQNNNYDEEGNSSIEEWKQRLATIFKAEVESSKLYNQLRYIDENGKEIVRVDFDTEKAKIITEDQLQDKSDRNYFIESSAMSKDDMYVSKVELNREGSPPTISFPLAPVIRYAVKIFDDITGDYKGIIIANTSLEEIIADNDIAEYKDGAIYILSQEGYYISHPDESKRWGGPNNLAHSANFYTDFPELEDIVKKNIFGSTITETDVIAYTEVQLHADQPLKNWILVKRVPKSVIFAPIESTISQAIWLVIGSFCVLSIVLAWITRTLLNPLKKLTAGAERVGKGNFSIVRGIESDDEIGILSKAFNSMARKLQTLYTSLETKVADRTKDLNRTIKEVQTEKEKVETILESIGDAVFVIDKNMNITMYNKICEELSGYSKKEAIGKPYHSILDFVNEETGQRSDDFIQAVFETGKIQTMNKKTILVCKNKKTIAVSDSAAPLKNEKNETIGAVIVFRDTSLERKIDQAKTEFVSLASHQLLTPLSAIKWNAEALMDVKEKIGKNYVTVLDDIYYSSERMAQLVNALLNVSRIDMGLFLVDPVDCDYREITHSLLKELVEPIKNKKLKVIKKFDKDIPILKADLNLARIILQNLLTNAIKYNTEKGTLTITITTKGKKLLISIADTGFGIPKKQHDNIFRKLFRADNVLEKDVDGNGLGLYLVKNIVDTVKGKIWFTSTANKGTTFFVELPLSGMKKKDGKRALSG